MYGNVYGRWNVFVEKEPDPAHAARVPDRMALSLVTTGASGRREYSLSNASASCLRRATYWSTAARCPR
jgi:hypothetical protein